MIWKRLAVLAACIALLCVPLRGTTGAHAQSVPPIGKYYIAMGDSYGAGYLNDTTPFDNNCVSPTAPGYVCVFYRALQRVNPNLQLVNLSVPGDDSCDLLNGTLAGSPCANPLHAPAVPSQVATAVAFIKAHPGQVNPLTIDIGGDDLLPLVPAAVADPAGTAAKLPGVLATYTANLDSILSQLRAAGGPNLNIIVVNQINPLGGLPTPPLPPGLSDIAKNAIGALDAVMAAEAKKYGATLADAASAFDAAPGGAASLTSVPSSIAAGGIAALNIHPTPTGYAVLAAAVLQASGYASTVLSATPVLFVRLHLAQRTFARSASGRVTGSATPGAALQFRIQMPGRYASAVSTAAPSGRFTLTFRAGAKAGPGRVAVCAAMNGASSCTHWAAFTIR